MEYTTETINYILTGAITTAEVWILTIVISFPIAIVVAIIRNNKIPVISQILTFITNIIRGTPLMLQLYVVYFAIPLLTQFKLDSFTSAIVGMIISSVAYTNEIIRVGIKSVEQSQYDAAKSLGMTYFQTMYFVILPQAIWRSIAGLANETVNRLYSTTLIALLGMDELLKNAKVIVIRTFDFSPFLIIAVIYLAFNNVVFFLVGKFEKKATKFISNQK